MQTTNKWTPGPSGTLLMGSLEVFKNFLLKQKFKIDLVFLITSFSLSVEEKSMQTRAGAIIKNLELIKANLTIAVEVHPEVTYRF